MIRLITIPKIMSIVVETVFKKSNFILFSGLNRAANKIGDAIITKTKKILFFHIPVYIKQENKQIKIQ